MLIETLVLGVQTTPDRVIKKSLWMAEQWARKSVWSWSVCFQDTTYDGTPVNYPTGHARITVRYFSTLKEGLVRRIR
ncbi:hypothetical protein LCGC14_0220290 [marine sediment metagenome]|uniref:Uncharacterized protein n=1 Tax=marine sediment metagenome TaxID=412755 RepID=A0A0F9XGW6_9ZZZZ